MAFVLYSESVIFPATFSIISFFQSADSAEDGWPKGDLQV